MLTHARSYLNPRSGIPEGSIEDDVAAAAAAGIVAFAAFAALFFVLLPLSFVAFAAFVTAVTIFLAFFLGFAIDRWKKYIKNIKIYINIDAVDP